MPDEMGYGRSFQITNLKERLGAFWDIFANVGVVTNFQTTARCGFIVGQKIEDVVNPAKQERYGDTQ